MSLFARLLEADNYQAANWDEKKHPRAKGGKFKKKGAADPVAPTEPAKPAEPPPTAAAAPAPSTPAAPKDEPTPPPPESPKASEPEKPAPATAAHMEKPKRVPSKYQKAIFDWITEKTKAPKAALIVDAKAGSGKTTTIEDALKLIPSNQKVVFLAFNKHIAEELERRTKGSDQVLPSTLSAFGWAACRKAYPWSKKDIIDHCHSAGLPIPDFKFHSSGPALDDKKVPNLVDQVLPKKEDRDKWKGDIVDLIRFKKQYYSEDENGKFNGPAIEEIAAKHEIDIPTGEDGARFMAAATDVWKRSIADTKIMDFADQVFFPAWKHLPLADKRKNLAGYQPEWCMVDETQDLSMTEASFVKRIAPRTICVGDPHQSIYLFKGSDPSSMMKLKATLGADQLPLSISYRCPKAVIAEAQKIVPTIEASPTAKEGSVDTIKWNAIAATAKPGSYVLCRTTAPLVQEALRMIAQGKKASVKGKDIGVSVGKLIEKVNKKGSDSTPIADFHKTLQEFLESEMKRLAASKKEHLIPGLEDKIETIHALSSGAKVVGDIRKRVDEIFSKDDSPGVTFSSIHKSKGLEADHIFIMRPDLLPHPKATGADQLVQEMNLKYVAITRSKDRLTWVEPPPKEEKMEDWEALADLLVSGEAQPGEWFEIGDTGYTAMICDGGPDCPDHQRASLFARLSEAAPHKCPFCGKVVRGQFKGSHVCKAKAKSEQADMPGNKYQSVSQSSSRTGMGTAMPPVPGAIPLQTMKVKKAPMKLQPGQ